MARRGRLQDTSGGGDGLGDDLSAAVVESLLQDGYGVEDIASFYDLPVKRVRRFLRRHGLEEPAAAYAEEGMNRSGRQGGRRSGIDIFEDPSSSSPWPDPGPPRAIGVAAGTRRPTRRLSPAQIDELCTLYLDPTLSLAEVASYFDLDAETAQELITTHLTGIVPA